MDTPTADAPAAVGFRLNGEDGSAPAGTSIADVVARLLPPGASTDGVAVAVDDEVVPRGHWQQRRVRQGDRVEVLTAVAGG
ncbi:hypothetical protein NUM3379_05260 [Kineococcus sp. NUM-3379]